MIDSHSRPFTTHSCHKSMTAQLTMHIYLKFFNEKAGSIEAQTSPS